MARDDEEIPRKRSLGKRVSRRLGKELLTLLLILIGLVAVGLLLLDSGPGHRFIADRIAALENEDCTEFRIGRIEGSIYNTVVLRNVEVRDPNGAFVTIDRAEMDWSPLAYLYRDIHIDRLAIDTLTMLRVPDLCPVDSDPDDPILPDIDIYIGALNVERVVVEEAVTGTRREGAMKGQVTLRAGRALVELQAALAGGDRIALSLDAAPDDDRFDLDLALASPDDGVLTELAGLDEAIRLDVEGEGSWTAWNGTAQGSIGDVEAIDLSILLDAGTYNLEGRVDPSPLVSGTVARLVEGGVVVDAALTFEDNVVAGDAMLTSAALRAVLGGGIDLGTNRFVDLDVGMDVRRPDALLADLGGERLRVVANLDGAFSTFDYDYRFNSPVLNVDALTLYDLEADGSGRWSRSPRRVPLTASASRVVGLGADFEAILRNLSLDTTLVVSDRELVSENLRFRSDKAEGTGVLTIDFSSGAIDFVLSANLTQYLIPGVGIVDVTTDLNIVPGAGGVQFEGNATARVRRLDNRFFAGLLGGLPVIETRLSRGADGIIRFSKTRLESPLLDLSGSGFRRRDGTYRFEASGTHERYGPVTLSMDGRLSRPSVDLVLASPNEALGLNDVAIALRPNAAGFSYVAEGGSRFGPFTSNGNILLPRGGGQAAIDVADLTVAGSSGSGRLAIVPGGFDGTLNLAGGEIGGTIDLSVPRGLRSGEAGQRIALDLTFDNAAFPGPPAIAARSGTLDGVILLREAGLSADFDFALDRATIAGLTFDRVTGSGRLENLVGTITASLDGSRQSEFDFDLEANFTPDSISISGAGMLQGRRLALVQPAVFRQTEDGWLLSDVDLRYGRGRARVSGLAGSGGPIDIALTGMPLRLADLISPDLGLTGTVSGTASYNPDTRNGRASFQVRDLSRSGLLLASQPIDMAVNAVIEGNQAGARVVMETDGQSLGRGQVRFAPLPSGNIASALLAAPMFAQIRYDGPAGTLWRLSNVELFDLTGPLDVALDARGSLLRPRISGVLRLDGAKLESPVTGTVVNNLDARGRFRGSRLIVESMTGTTPGNGRLSGSGDFTFLPGGIGIDLGIRATNARLLARDDIAATVTGPLRISSRGNGGLISGNLQLDEGRYALGRAGRVAEVASIEVIERGLDPDLIIEQERISPWRLDIDVAGGPLSVTGLGLESTWTTDVSIAGSALEPQITGSADLLRGEYNFAGRRFRVERGDIDFNGNAPPNPTIDVLAVADGVGIDAQVRVTGSALEPQISFTSPGVSDQDEILSRLLFGTSVANLSAAELLQLGAAVASLQDGGGGLDPINAVRTAIGLDRLRILPADIATGQGTAIGAGKYITRRLYVEVITDGQGYTATQAEFQVTNWLALLAEISSIGRAGVNARYQRDY
ncbi:translocation/assembly module TamB domain-containing protein [Sphingomicrobium sp. XHP0239]|uniref:translocation/assembly module TamB domain-containing protein n=1 Tax=Sphingomicrobium maritimum TaxID=3133972 RepID=UPI0031CC8B7D